MSTYADPESIIRSTEDIRKAIDEAAKPGTSNIQKFFENSTAFITGGNGFLGKQLVEKLLRSTDIKKLFLLIRSKKGLSNSERLEQVLNDPLFDKLRKEKPGFTSKLVCVDGDISHIGLGIKKQDWSDITEQADIIIHLAATTKFDEDLRVASFINLRGTKETVNLAKACNKLRSFVHVSTAFSHATRSMVGKAVFEQFYPTPVHPQLFLEMAETIEGNTFYEASKGFLQDWPNTYTFTKALAEEYVRLEASDLPVCIVRPPYVMSTYHEPAPGWVDSSCVYGPSGMLIGIGLGVVHVSLNRDIKLALAPCDYVNNAIMAAAWEAGKNQHGGRDIQIYNVTNIEYNMGWGTLRKKLESEQSRRLNTSKCVWYSFIVETSSSFMYLLLTWLLHYIPAYLIDGLCFLTGLKKPKRIKSFVKLYQKLYNFGLTFKYFFANEWYFDDTNLQKLKKKMAPEDRVIFEFDIRKIDWDQLLLIWIVGLRKYVLKDDIKDNSGYKKQKYFKLIHYLLVLSYVSFIIFGFYMLFQWLF